MDPESGPGSQSIPKPDRLGLCEVCNFLEAKYTCPKCEVKTCCLKCLNIHKKELECTGIRDKTKFIPIKNMTKMDYMSDYTFLEEFTRYVSDRKRDKLKRFTRLKNLPSHLFKLRCAAHERKISLHFLLANFSQHNVNTTYYDWKTKIIHWRVEWIFTNASNVKLSDERCSEAEPLSKLVGKYINANDSFSTDLVRKSLQFYQSRGFTGLRVLLKAEGVKRCKNRFFELDLGQTLRENLVGKTVVEFPTIYVIYDEIAQEFETIDSDDDIEKETKMHMIELDQKYNSRRANEQSTDGKIDGEMDRLRIEKKKSAERRARAANPTNFLFAGDDNDVSSSSDSGDEAEEAECANKRIKLENL